MSTLRKIFSNLMTITTTCYFVKYKNGIGSLFSSTITSSLSFFTFFKLQDTLVLRTTVWILPFHSFFLLLNNDGKSLFIKYWFTEFFRYFAKNQVFEFFVIFIYLIFYKCIKFYFVVLQWNYFWSYFYELNIMWYFKNYENS